jgi:hypothetical protein
LPPTTNLGHFRQGQKATNWGWFRPPISGDFGGMDWGSTNFYCQHLFKLISQQSILGIAINKPEVVCQQVFDAQMCST